LIRRFLYSLVADVVIVCKYLALLERQPRLGQDTSKGRMSISTFTSAVKRSERDFGIIITTRLLQNAAIPVGHGWLGLGKHIKGLNIIESWLVTHIISAFIFWSYIQSVVVLCVTSAHKIAGSKQQLYD
jgi:hypothetical protein